jgi:hypothetical protein
MDNILAHSIASSADLALNRFDNDDEVYAKAESASLIELLLLSRDSSEAPRKVSFDSALTLAEFLASDQHKQCPLTIL